VHCRRRVHSLYRKRVDGRLRQQVSLRSKQTGGPQKTGLTGSANGRVSIEVILVGHPHGKIGSVEAWDRDHHQEEINSNSLEHRLGWILLLCPHDMTCTIEIQGN
jgi:hypothetical protein